MKLRHIVTSLIISFAVALQAHGAFISAPPLAQAVIESKLILRITVLDEGRSFEMEGGKVFKISRCKIAAKLKNSENLPESAYLSVDEIFIACPAHDQFGTLKKGDDCIVFCITGGHAPTVLNGGYIYKIEKGAVSVPKHLLPGAIPDEAGSESMDVQKFTQIIANLVEQ